MQMKHYVLIAALCAGACAGKAVESGQRDAVKLEKLDGKLLKWADPFWGNGVTRVPVPKGNVAKWSWYKARTGNTHPGPQVPFGMVSVTAYSGAYPSGYGNNPRSRRGHVEPLFNGEKKARGFTHFQQTGTGGIGYYYNFLQVTPTTERESGTVFPLHSVIDDIAYPGYYACTLKEPNVRVELTASDKTAYHRYNFKSPGPAQLTVNLFSHGLPLARKATAITVSEAELHGKKRLTGHLVHGEFPYYFCMEVKGNVADSALFLGTRVKINRKGQVRCKASAQKVDKIKTAFEPKTRSTENKCQEWVIDFADNKPVDVRVAFSFRSREQAIANLNASPENLDQALAEAEKRWEDALSRIPYKDNGDERMKELVYSALYHSLLKPTICMDESPWWKESTFAVEFCTLWDTYKTQLPMVIKYYPGKATHIINGMINAIEHCGYFPSGFMRTTNFTRFDGQTSGVAWAILAFAHKNNIKGVDWKRALKCVPQWLERPNVKKFMKDGMVSPLEETSITHTLDLVTAFSAICYIAKAEGDVPLYNKLKGYRENWRNCYDTETGFLRQDSKFYEGKYAHYSFRPHYGMKERVKLAGGKEKFTEMLDEYFGFTAVENGYTAPDQAKFVRLYTFEGLNNQVDLLAPWAYRWSDKPDRFKDVIKGAFTYQFALGENGLPGNNDSGGLSAWVVLSALGDMPLVEYFED